MIETIALTASQTPYITSVIGKTFLSNAISESCHEILTKITSLYSHPSFSHLLEEMEAIDIETQIKIVDAHIEEIEKEYTPIFLESHRSLFLSIQGLHHIINRIKEEVILIHSLMENHSLKWFSSWRSVGGEDNIEKLKKYKEILDNRTGLFFKIISLIEKK